MSYILEALNKSEQDRQQQNTASLSQYYDSQTPVPNQKGPSAWWAVGLLAAALIILLAMVWWWHLVPNNRIGANNNPSTTETTGVTTQKNVEKPKAETPAEDKKDAPTKPLDPRIAELYKNKPADSEQEEAPTAPVTLAPDTVASVTTITSTKPAISSVIGAEPPASKTIQTETNQSFLSIEDLPDAIKSELFPIRYVAHVYADSQKQGFAILNDVKLKPGDKLSQDFYLEKVAPDHVIVSFRGYFFRLEAMQDWEGF